MGDFLMNRHAIILLKCAAILIFIGLPAVSQTKDASARNTTPLSMTSFMGVDPTGSTDSTAGVQAFFNTVCSPTFSGQEVWVPKPSVGYKITQTITCQGNLGMQLHLVGEAGPSQGPTGSTFLWTGDAYSPAFYFLGVNQSLIENLEVAPNGGSTLRVGVWLDATNALSSTVTNISSIARSSNVVTVQTDAASGAAVDLPYRIAGTADSTLNGLFLVATVTDPTHFTYRNVGSNTSLGAGGTSTGVVSTPSSGTVFRGPSIGQVTGTNSYAILLGRNGSNQISEVRIENPVLLGAGRASSTAGVKSVGANNVENHAVVGGSVAGAGFAVGLDMSGTAGNVLIEGVTFGGNALDIKAGNTVTTIVGGESECTDCQFLTTGGGANSVMTSVEGFAWNSGAVASGCVIVQSSGALTLLSGSYRNITSGSTFPKICTSSVIPFGSSSSMFTSIGVDYYNAGATFTGGYIPVFNSDGSVNLMTNPDAHLQVTSFNDLGGTGGSQERLIPYAGNAPPYPYLVANLPSCDAASTGAKAAVINATSPSFLGTLTGGGGVYVPVICNGTAWVAY